MHTIVALRRGGGTLSPVALPRAVRAWRAPGCCSQAFFVAFAREVVEVELAERKLSAAESEASSDTQASKKGKVTP